MLSANPVEHEGQSVFLHAVLVLQSVEADFFPLLAGVAAQRLVYAILALLLQLVGNLNELVIFVHLDVGKGPNILHFVLLFVLV